MNGPPEIPSGVDLFRSKVMPGTMIAPYLNDALREGYLLKAVYPHQGLAAQSPDENEQMFTVLTILHPSKLPGNEEPPPASNDQPVIEVPVSVPPNVTL